MIRTGVEYRESIRDGREVWIDGERVDDVTTHPAFKPIVDVRARIYDMAHEEATARHHVLRRRGDRRALRRSVRELPLTREDWHAKRAAVDTVLDDVGGIVTRVGDETVGEMWSLYDGQDVLNEIDPQFSENIRHHVATPRCADPFHVSANTDPKGDRSKRPQDQDPDVLLRRRRRERQRHHRARRQVRDGGGLRQPGVRQADDRRLGRGRPSRSTPSASSPTWARPGSRTSAARASPAAAPAEDYPLSNRFDEIDTMIVFDDVEIPWENVLLLPAHAGRRLHPRDAAPLQHVPVRPAPPAARRPAGRAGLRQRRRAGVKMHQGVREKLAELACYREGINAHLTAAIELAEESPGGLLMPNQALLYTGRVLRLLAAAGDDAPRPRPVRRPDLRDPQRGVVRRIPIPGALLEKYYRIGDVEGEDRRRFFALARDLLNSDYAGHRLTFQLFAQSPAFSHLLAVYNNYDFDGPLDLVRNYMNADIPTGSTA